MLSCINMSIISIKRKILLITMALAFSLYNASSMLLCFCTNSFQWKVGPFSSIVVWFYWNNKMALLIMPFIRKHVLIYWEAYIQWHIGLSVNKSVECIMSSVSLDVIHSKIAALLLIAYIVYLSSMQTIMVHSKIENLLFLIHQTESAKITAYMNRDPYNYSWKKKLFTLSSSF